MFVRKTVHENVAGVAAKILVSIYLFFIESNFLPATSAPKTVYKKALSEVSQYFFGKLEFSVLKLPVNTIVNLHFICVLNATD